MACVLAHGVARASCANTYALGGYNTTTTTPTTITIVYHCSQCGGPAQCTFCNYYTAHDTLVIFTLINGNWVETYYGGTCTDCFTAPCLECS